MVKIRMSSSLCFLCRSTRGSSSDENDSCKLNAITISTKMALVSLIFSAFYMRLPWELQGLPVRNGEIEFMQSLFPEGMVTAASLAIIAMLFSYKRFKYA